MSTTSENRSRELNGLHCIKSRRKVIVMIVLVILFLSWLISSSIQTRRLSSYISRLPAASRGLDSELVRRECLQSKSSGQNIQEIYATIQELRHSMSRVCQDFLGVFDSILSIEEIVGAVTLPEKFAVQVKAWLGNKEDLFKQIYNQKIYKVVSFISHEETLFNLLRSKRPISKSGVDPVTYVDQLVNSSSTDCDFCKYKDHTAADVFGRVESKYSATSSNTFKLAKFHALFFPYSHHPLHLNHSVLHDLFVTTANGWFQRAFKLDPAQRYPSLLWDSLPHAGASQVHPHVHGLLDDKQYVGEFEQLHKSSKQYYETIGRFLWPDFIQIHKFFGLTLEEGSAVAIVPITARKDHEYWIISPQLNDDAVKLIGRVLDAYRNGLNTFCHSAGGVLPVLGSNPSSLDMREGLPMILRIGSRGDCTSVRSDVSSLELYAVNNINSDLAQTISALRNTPLRA